MVAPRPVPLTLEVDLNPVIEKLEALQTNIGNKIGSAKDETIGKVIEAKDDIGSRVNTVSGVVTGVDTNVKNVQSDVDDVSAKVGNLDTSIGTSTIGQTLHQSSESVIGEMPRLARIQNLAESIDGKIPTKISSGQDAVIADVKRIDVKLDSLVTLINRLHFEMLIQPLCAGHAESAALSQFLDSKFGIRSVEHVANWTDDAAAVQQQIQKHYDDNKFGLTAPTAAMVESVRAKARAIVGQTGPTHKKK